MDFELVFHTFRMPNPQLAQLPPPTTPNHTLLIQHQRMRLPQCYLLYFPELALFRFYGAKPHLVFFQQIRIRNSQLAHIAPAPEKGGSGRIESC